MLFKALFQFEGWSAFISGIGNALAVILFPLLMFGFQLGVSGAALSTVISQ